jgi:hypothetical protein
VQLDAAAVALDLSGIGNREPDIGEFGADGLQHAGNIGPLQLSVDTSLRR